MIFKYANLRSFFGFFYELIHYRLARQITTMKYTAMTMPTFLGEFIFIVIFVERHLIRSN